MSGAGTITSVPAGIGCPGDCSELVGAGHRIVLTAAGEFGFWGGDCKGEAPSCTLTPEADAVVRAVFAGQ